MYVILIRCHWPSRPLFDIYATVFIYIHFQPGLTNGPSKVQDENRTVRQIINEKNIVPPVAQFRAFSVYEDKPSEAELKKREPTFKPFVAKDVKKDNFFKNAAENVKALCAQVEKQSDWQKDASHKRYVISSTYNVEKS